MSLEAFTADRWIYCKLVQDGWCDLSSEVKLNLNNKEIQLVLFIFVQSQIQFLSLTVIKRLRGNRFLNTSVLVFIQASCTVQWGECDVSPSFPCHAKVQAGRVSLRPRGDVSTLYQRQQGKNVVHQ